MSATSSAARGIEVGLGVVGRLAGPVAIAIAGAELCTTKTSWGWFVLGLIGAGLTVAQRRRGKRKITETKATTQPTTQLTHESLRIIGVDELKALLNENKTEDKIESDSDIDNSSVKDNNQKDLIADLTSAMVNLGRTKNVARDIAMKSINKAPQATLEELIKIALKGG